LFIVDSVKSLVLDELSDDWTVLVDLVLDVLVELVLFDLEGDNDEEKIKVSLSDVLRFLCLLLCIEIWLNTLGVVALDSSSKVLRP
jgi:hypothetical protein